MTSIASLTVDLVAKTASFEASLKQSAARTKEMSENVKSMREVVEGANKVLSAFGVSIGLAEIVSLGKEAIHTAASISELAARAGLTAQEFQGIEFAASKTGLGIEEIDTAMARFTRTVGEAASGNRTAIEGFNALGVGVLDVNGHVRSSATLFAEVARAIAEIPAPANRATEEVGKFGRSGQALDEFIREFADGKASIDQLADAARAAGFSFDDGLISKAKEAQHEMELWRRQAEVFAVTWTDKFLTALHATPGAADDAFKELKPLADTLNQLNAAAIAAGQSVRDAIIAGAAMSGGAQIVAEIPVGSYQPPSRHVPHPLTGDSTDSGSYNPAPTGTATAARKAEAAAIREEKSALLDYLATLQQEQAQLALSDTAREEYKALLEASAAAQKDYDAGLRDSPLLTGEEAAAIRQNVDQLEAMKTAASEAQSAAAADSEASAKKIQEQAQQTQQFIDEINAGVEQVGNEFIDAATGVKSWGDAAKAALGDVLKLVAKLIEQQLALSFGGGSGGGGGGGLGGILAGLFGFGGGGSDGGFLSGFSFDTSGINFLPGFADGGAVTGGVPITVGERGSETFVPATNGWIMPHGATAGAGGAPIVINNAYDFRGSSVNQADVQRAVDKGNKQTYAAVFAAMNRGGPEAKAAGRRPHR